MRSALGIFFILSFLSAGCVAAAWYLVLQLDGLVDLPPEVRRRQTVRWLLPWSLKGLLVPLGIWVLMNLGLSWDLQAFMPQVQLAQNRGGNWGPALLRVIGSGLFVLSTYWTALTLGWGLVKVRAEMPKEAQSTFKGLCWTCSVAMMFVAVPIVLMGGWPAVGFAAAAILAPIAGYAPGMFYPRKMPPMYARAIARMKFGKYAEAETEIIRELEKREDDFEGWMMLADLYANHFNDLREAEQTILDLCDQPKVNASQISVALHRLADWHLKVAGDPEAARRALQMVCDRFPGSHLARMARLRINQLPANAEELRQQRSAPPIHLPALGDSLDEVPAQAESKEERKKAAAMANACVEKLKQDPDNIGAREKLARLFAERLGRPDQGLDQLELLLDMAGQSEANRAEWLSLSAAWRIKYQHDFEAGRKALERVIREFPHRPQALAARRRLQLMETEARARGA